MILWFFNSEMVIDRGAHGADLQQTLSAAIYRTPLSCLPLPPLPERSGTAPSAQRTGRPLLFTGRRVSGQLFPGDWQSCELYLYGIDLFNYGYWWEAHEALETVWHAAGQKSTLCGTFIQGLIQLAGAQLKRFIAEPGGHSRSPGPVIRSSPW